ncbi:MAG: hypothetical protein IJE40_04730 [Clostridia bacterium]|nr:hypothetical protein [Clostridia bacterium]
MEKYLDDYLRLKVDWVIEDFGRKDYSNVEDSEFELILSDVNITGSFIEAKYTDIAAVIINRAKLQRLFLTFSIICGEREIHSGLQEAITLIFSWNMINNVMSRLCI